MYLNIIKIKSVPVYFHWTLIPMGIFISFLAEFKLLNTLIGFLSYLFLIFIHEAGHLVFASRRNLKVFNIIIYGMGGVCNTEQPRTKNDALMLYSGGFVFQIVLLVLAIFIVSLLKEPIPELIKPAIIVFIYINIILLITNMIPSKMPGGLETDGKQILKVLRGNQNK
jgi:hypothetical protein